jgi:hypothetical protein
MNSVDSDKDVSGGRTGGSLRLKGESSRLLNNLEVKLCRGEHRGEDRTSKVL